MKRLLILALLVAGVSTATDARPRVIYPHTGNDWDGIEAGVGFFYSSLSPYGEWINCDYGLAWRPYRVGHSWRPYMHGRWVWTSYGWYWASEEPFGWATFHYGRWYYDDYYGWIWTPGDVWGPAWVEWRYDDDYIGWAPLPPMASFNVSVGITFGNSWVAPVHYWNFVPCRNFTSVRVVDYVQPIDRCRRIFAGTHRTVNIRTENDRVVNRGIDVGFVERRGNVRINQIDVVQNNRGTGDRVVRENNRDRIEVFRPRLDTRTNGDEMRHPEVQRADKIPADRMNEQDRANREMINRGVYDRQQARIPHEGNSNEGERQVRQNRELDQKFEIPMRGNRGGGRGDEMHERSARMSPKDAFGQQRHPEVQRPQREEHREWKQPEKQREQSRDQEKHESRTRGRRP